MKFISTNLNSRKYIWNGGFVQWEMSSTKIIEHGFISLGTWNSSVALLVTRPSSQYKYLFPGLWIPILKIRRSRDPLNFNIGTPILVRRHLYIKTAPWAATKRHKCYITLAANQTYPVCDGIICSCSLLSTICVKLCVYMTKSYACVS